MSGRPAPEHVSTSNDLRILDRGADRPLDHSEWREDDLLEDLVAVRADASLGAADVIPHGDHHDVLHKPALAQRDSERFYEGDHVDPVGAEDGLRHPQRHEAQPKERRHRDEPRKDPPERHAVRPDGKPCSEPLRLQLLRTAAEDALQHAQRADAAAAKPAPPAPVTHPEPLATACGVR
eukprot:CAMPEP_0115839224 /NCGR_PEP_ID=MMETSP0287-20121206/6142_1 /TAXON_ID=412157 /ORGANISM="Chrysochromulina rotalis, Strain UIO044" /LENGTH=178 /DNA_ID=CAMNT_0003292791 /DNA_START=415 /DNA_END=947 /DNA_ORIENTATION=-